MIVGRRVRDYRRITLLGLLVRAVLWLLLVAVAGGLLVAAWPLVVTAGWAFATA